MSPRPQELGDAVLDSERKFTAYLQEWVRAFRRARETVPMTGDKQHPVFDDATHRSDVEDPPRLSIPANLRRIRPLRWLLWFVLDWLVIIAVFWWVAHAELAWWIFPLVVLVIGSRQHALALLGHDAAHRLAFKHRRVNDLLGELFIAWPLWVVLEDGYRQWHFSHHRDLGRLEDPELDYLAGVPYSGRVTWLRIGRCFLLDLFGFGTFDFIKFVRLVLPYKNPRRVLGPACLWLTVGLLLYQFGLLYILGLWTLSALTGFWAVFRIRTFTEHVGIPASGKESSHRFVAGPLTRFLFFPHNTWCHYEHHKWPQVPFYNLPSLRNLDGSKPILQLWELFPLY